MSNSTTTRQLSARKAVQFVGTYAGPLALAAFGFALWHYNANENLFSFAAWGTLDFLMGACMYYAGSKKDSHLPIAYGVSAFFVVAMIYRNGQWDWTIVETICLIGTIIAMIGWWWFGAIFGVVAFGAALAIASVPILISTYHNPQTWEWWLWIGTGMSATWGLYLNKPWTLRNIADWLFVAISEGITVTMLVLLLWPLF